MRPEAAGAESDTLAGALGEAGCAAELDPHAWRNESGAVGGEPEGDRCADADGEGGSRLSRTGTNALLVLGLAGVAVVGGYLLLRARRTKN